jgi:two-component system sensor histidine kinase MprB
MIRWTRFGATPSFRLRLVLLSTGAVSVAIVAAALIVYAIVHRELDRRVNDSLHQEVRRAAGVRFWVGGSSPAFGRVPRPAFGGAGAYLQLVSASGQTFRSEFDSPQLPVNSRVRQAASAVGGEFFFDTWVRGVHLRILSAPVGDGWALEAAQPLTDRDKELSSMRFWLIAVSMSGVAVASLLGLGVARAALAPVRRLTAATDYVSKTQDLGSRIDVRGTDELSHLASSFNIMLEALERSASSQRRLVADASHELKTPLTSLRTNIEVLLLGGDALDPAERTQLLNDVVQQIEEMSALISELVDLARGDAELEEMRELRFDQLVENAVERAQRRRPSNGINSRLEETSVFGADGSLQRAVLNLLDNAAKWSPPGAAIDVQLKDGELTVRDHGPGIAPDDLPHIFERFYRSVDSRSLPGSGLGLAIVKQVVDQHNGTISAENGEDGGTVMRLRLPTITIERADVGGHIQRLKL